MAAQPFGDRQRGGEGEDAQRPAHPDSARAAQRRSPVRAPGRPAGRYRERHQPAEGLGVDQEGVADPVQAGQEKAEAEAPAGDRRAPASAARSVRRRRRRSARPTPGRSGRGPARALNGASASADSGAGGERDGRRAASPTGEHDRMGERIAASRPLGLVAVASAAARRARRRGRRVTSAATAAWLPASTRRARARRGSRGRFARAPSGA